MTPIERILSRLEMVREVGPRRWVAQCPGHHDRSPSLSVRETNDRRVLLHDFAGCEVTAVIAALDLTIQDLFTRNERRAMRPITLQVGTSRRSVRSRYEVKAIGPVTEPQIRALKSCGYEFAPVLYREAAAFAVQVSNRETGKAYSALGFKGFIGIEEGWKLWVVSENGRLWRDEKTGKLRRFNIGPADLIVARSLWNFFPVDRLVVMEGESDLLAYLKLGDRNVITTSCGAGNTSAFKRPDARMWLRYKKPREVYVYGDNDEAGRDGARMRAEALRAILPGARIFLPRLPERFGDFRDLIGGEKENAIGSN